MADGTATFRLALDASGATAGAADAAGAVEEMKEQLLGGMAEMRNLNNAMRTMKAGGLASTDMYKSMAKAQEQGKLKMASLQMSFLEAGGSLAKTKPKIKATGAALDSVKASAAGAAPPAKSLVSQFRALKSSGHPLVTVAVAVGAALLAIAAAAAAATAALMAYGLAQANARRNELIRFEGLVKMRRFGMMGMMGARRGPGDPNAMQKTLDRVSASVAVGRGQLEGYTRQLYRMGLRGGNLTNTLEAMAYAASAGDEKQAQLYKHMALMAGLTGSSMRKVADDAKARFGAVVARQMLSLDVQSKKLRESFSMLFSGLDLEPLLKGLKEITSQFSQQTVTGRALKELVEFMFQPIIDFAGGDSGPLIKIALQGAVLAALKLEGAVLKAYIAIKDRLAMPGILKGFDLEMTAAAAGAMLLTVTLGAAASAIMMIVVGAALLAGPFVLAGIAIAGLIALTRDLFEDTDWGAAGTALVTSLVDSVTAGTGPFGAAMKELAKSGLQSFKDLFGIKSPSRIMFRAGVNLTGGLTGALTAGRSGVVRSMKQLVAPPPVAATARVGRSLAAPQMAAAGAGGSRGITLHVAPGAVVIDGGGGEDIERLVGRAFEDLAERILIQLGGR